MQDIVINEHKDSPKPSDCCIPTCYDKVEELDIEYTILTALENMVMEHSLYPYIVHDETLSNIEISLRRH